ncbi:hypothetical protein DVR12_26710 [Chitinophaga silvatica]|uniref:Lipoprotein n=1 Tax=Chitinophaga silvatica TaxID=2282649 RepID=A0A3E1Y2B2_9BACT|nr:hypothetical protein [Chitinophaga silvatica]RFS18793.1 hypothetical protein DVR12_26710 [Chitinophaga silvatica]
MKKNVLALSLQIIFVFLLSSCAKEIVSDYPLSLNPGPNGTTTTPNQPADSKYEFVAVNGACSNATVEGIFTEGKAVTETNFLLVTVYVTKTGPWSMTTPVANGVSFSGQGTFTATGLQSIKLPATGTPVKPQVTTVAMTASNGNCSVNFTVEDSAPTNIADDFHFKFIIDGKTYEQLATNTSGYTCGASSNSTTVGVFSSAIYNTANPFGDKTKVFMVDIGLMPNAQTASTDQFKSFFTTTNHPIAESAAATTGVIITMSDVDNTIWTSATAQSNTSFKVLSAEPLNLTGIYYLKVKMIFTCKFVNLGTGAVKEVKNGEATMLFVKP